MANKLSIERIGNGYIIGERASMFGEETKHICKDTKEVVAFLKNKWGGN